MLEAKLVLIPLYKDDDLQSSDATFYRKIIGSLQYLTMTRPDILGQQIGIIRAKINHYPFKCIEEASTLH